MEQNHQQQNPKTEYDTRREEKLREKESAAKKRQMKKVVLWGVSGGLVMAAIAGIVWYAATRPPIPESEIISRSGFHWHPELTMYASGEKQEIPANIGIGGVHQPIHTHTEDAARGVIHMEFQGLVRKEDATIGRFFDIWGKDAGSFGILSKMTVNGQENTEFENYVMRDRDKIELYYE